MDAFLFRLRCGVTRWEDVSNVAKILYRRVRERQCVIARGKRVLDRWENGRGVGVTHQKTGGGIPIFWL